jgi:hypothetical protein
MDEVLYNDTHIMDVAEYSNLTFRGTLCNLLFHTSNTSERTVRLCTTPELLESNFKSAILCNFKSRGFPEPSNWYTLLQPITLRYSHTYPCSLHSMATDLNNPFCSMALLSVIQCTTQISCDMICGSDVITVNADPSGRAIMLGWNILNSPQKLG